MDRLGKTASATKRGMGRGRFVARPDTLRQPGNELSLPAARSDTPNITKAPGNRAMQPQDRVQCPGTRGCMREKRHLCETARQEEEQSNQQQLTEASPMESTACHPQIVIPQCFTQPILTHPVYNPATGLYTYIHVPINTAASCPIPPFQQLQQAIHLSKEITPTAPPHKQTPPTAPSTAERSTGQQQNTSTSNNQNQPKIPSLLSLPRIANPSCTPDKPRIDVPVPIACRMSRADPDECRKECWNCDARTHSWRACDKPRTKFCRNCGTKGYYVSSCPRCAEEYKKMQRRIAEGRK